MTTTTRNGFATRLKSVKRKHTRMAHGYDAKVSRDGLIVFRPKRRKAGLPLRGLLLAVAAFFGFKVLVMLQLGAGAYDTRVATLQSGTTVEQIGAAIMQVDPVSGAIAGYLAPHF